MKSLTDVYNQVASHDAELEKQAAVLIKQAEEEDAAGRIMARGFADELNKIAQPQGTFDTLKKPEFGKGGFGGTVQSGGYQTGGGKTGQGYDPMAGKNRTMANQQAATMAGGGSKGGMVGAPPAGGVGAKKPPAPGGAAPARPPVVAGGALPRPGKLP